MSTAFVAAVRSGPFSPTGFVLGFARRLGAVARALVNRRQVHGLLDLDDRALKDIGLTRGDVIGALTQPLDRDPSTILRLRSIEHRVRRRTRAPSG